jgi:tripartite-type tricarboxylate transporter receptor subunit TctC
MRCTFIQLASLPFALCFGQPCDAWADAVTEFYRQRTITFVSVFAPGGTYDLYSRLVATHLPNFIPGNPRIIVQYMPGAGGLTGAIHLATQAPQDGTEIGMVDRAIAVNQVQRTVGVLLDANKFQWIGSVSSYGGVLQVAGRTGVKTADDLRRIPLVLGSWGVETSSYTMPVLLNALAGTKFKVVTGYRGAAEVDLAVESGEVDGRISSWSTLKYTKAAQLADGKVAVVMQSGLKRNPDLPQVPLIGELAATEQGRRILEFIDSDSGIGWSVVAPPGVPLDRVAALRQAFDRMVEDPKFLGDAQAKHLDVVPSTGQEIEALVRRTVSIPREDIDAMNKLLSAKR